MAVILFFDDLKDFLIEQYGNGFYEYSVGFILEGKKGIQDEGTVSMVADFLKVLPTTFPEALIGYGFYGGSDFNPWTDSGYPRMFLSVGYLFGSLYYICFLLMLRKIFNDYRMFFILTLPMLFIAELKEPLLFTGYASRTIFILMAFLILQKKYDYHLKR